MKLSIKGQGHSLTLVKGQSDLKVKCLTFDLYTQVSKSGPHDGPLVLFPIFNPVLNMYGSPIPVVEEAKFLSLLFDKKLCFIPHIKALKAKCLKALDILKVLSNTN